MLKSVYIRADGGTEIGLGHLVRCFALSQMLMEYFSVSFYCQEVPESFLEDLISVGIGCIRIRDEFTFFESLTGDEIVVLDHYQLDSDYQKSIKDKGCKVVCLDDLNIGHFYADLVINSAPGVAMETYLPNIEPYTRLALGLEFALLRSSFLKLASQPPRQSERIKTAFICFGGGDFKNLTEASIFECVRSALFDEIIVVVGASYRYYKSLKAKISLQKEIKLYQNVDEVTMVSLLQKSDLFIVPSSGILLEVFCTGGKVISGWYVDNQKHLFEYCKKHKKIISADDFNSESLRRAINEAVEGGVVANPSLVIDGCSGERILKLFLKMGCSLRPVTEKDDLTLFQWANDIDVRNNSFCSDPITWHDHLTWLGKKLIDPKCRLFILEISSIPLGQIRFEYKNDYWEIGYSIDAKFRGMGLGTKIIELGLNMVDGPIIAKVKPQNLGSRRVFNKLGFIELVDVVSISYKLYDNKFFENKEQV